MNGTKTRTKQAKIGVPIETYKAFKNAASDSKRKIAQVAEIAIHLYQQSIREEKPLATMRANATT